jgi:aspartate/methionine/tyrosine aminotransferase
LIEQYIIKYFDNIVKLAKPQIKKTLAQRQKISVYMDSIGLKYLPGTGTFYFMVSIENSKLNSEDFAWKLLKDRNVSTVPGIGYGKSVGKFLRISVGAEPMARIKQGLDHIKQLMEDTKQ